VLFIYPLMVAVITLGFLAAIRGGLNRRLNDPSMAMPQMIAALVPWAYIVYEFINPLARGLALLLSVVTLLYGLLGLDRRRLLLMSALTVAVYLGVLAVIAWERPDQVDPVIDGLWLLGLVIVLAQLSWIGGYVSELRMSLRARNEELHTLATQDMLTRLPNRRYLLGRLSAEAARMRRAENKPAALSICLIDLDEFKRVNDTLGHALGDSVLQAVAERMQSALRESDCVGRFGGEEFLVILPETDLAGGVSSAQRIREKLRSAPVDDLPEGWSITATYGVAEYRAGERLEDTLARADAALYRGKHQGRDCITVDDS
jgi:diguanylate cyclase